MFPSDLILFAQIVRWVSMKLYSKMFGTKYLPITDSNTMISKLQKSFYYTGTITEIKGDIALIDGRYSFSTSQVSEDVYVGNIVTSVITTSANGMVCGLTVMDIVSDSADCLVAPRINSTARGIIIKRDGRTFSVSPGPLEFNLDEVITKFIPEIGDLIELHIEKESDPDCRIINIYPYGYKVISGMVTSYENDCGFINDTVVFHQHHCQPGYQPEKDDHVVLSIIRCQNGSTQFRALHVAPIANKKRNHLKQSDRSTQNFVSNFTFYPKDVICVNLNESKLVDAELINNSTAEYKLLKLKAYTTESMIELIEPTDVTLSLKPKSTAFFKFKITMKYCGFSSIDIDFIFENITHNCSLNFLAVGKENDFVVSQFEVNKEEHIPKMIKMYDKINVTGHNFMLPNKAAIPGRHFVAPIKFYPVKLGTYEIPNQILSILKNGEKGRTVKKELETFYPCLEAGLRKENYKIFMHCLLYFEESAQLDKVSKLQLISGFDKKNDFLVLPVEEESNFTLLQPGDKVYARKPWETDGDVYEGVIWSIHSKELHIKFSRSFHYDYVSRSEYFLNFSVGRSQIKYKHQAIDDAVHQLGINWLFPHQTSCKPPFIIQVLDESEESDSKVNLNSKRNTKWNRQGPGYGNRQQKYTFDNDIPIEKKRVFKWFNSDLNHEQKNAVINCLRAESRPFPYLIFGPPGTGKSMTLVEVCLQIYKLIPESRIMLVAPSNSAADHLSLNLIGSGFIEENDFVRLGGFRYVNSANIPDGLVGHVCVPDIGKEDQYSVDEIPRINRHCLSEKRLIISTVGTIANLQTMGFPNGYFTHFLIDEAGQVLEPANLIVACLMSNESQMILAGDPLQLGPVVISYIAKNYGLAQSFLHRLMSYKPYMFDKVGFPDSYGYNPKFITKLVRSYRSLPKLLCLISSLFYRNELKPMVDEKTSHEANIYSQIRELYPSESQVPILFHSIAGKESVEDGTFSFFNNEEVFQVCTYLSQLYRLGVHPFNIGIITPYIAQIKKIVQFIDSLDQEMPKIGSVEEFQGQEKDIIILSTVRSSLILDPNINQMSFIFNPQRINVAISRAKAALIIVGNSSTLGNDEIWRKIIQYCIENKSYRR